MASCRDPRHPAENTREMQQSYRHESTTHTPLSSGPSRLRHTVSPLPPPRPDTLTPGFSIATTEQSRADGGALRRELPVLRLQRMALPARWHGGWSGRHHREHTRAGSVRRAAARGWERRGRRSADVGRRRLTRVVSWCLKSFRNLGISWNYDGWLIYQQPKHSCY